MPTQAILDSIAGAKIVTIEKMSGMTMFVIDPTPSEAPPATEGGMDAAMSGMEDADVVTGDRGAAPMMPEKKAEDGAEGAAKKGYITVAIPDDQLGDAQYAEGDPFIGGGEDVGEADVKALEQYR